MPCQQFSLATSARYCELISRCIRMLSAERLISHRSLAHWRLYVTLLRHKRDCVHKAALMCFGLYSQRVWLGWRHLARLSAKLRAAQATRKVHSPAQCQLMIIE